jgi:two-component sensor histidine kinase
LVGTVLLGWRRSAPITLRRKRMHSVIEGVVLAVGLGVTAGWAFLWESGTQHVYLIFPFLVWAALRFGVQGACLGVIATTAVAVGSALSNVGPFAPMSTIDTVASLQALIAVVVISTFMLAFSTEEALQMTERLRQEVRRRSEAQNELREAYAALEQVNVNLDQLVAHRTNELRRSLTRNELMLKELQHRVKNNLQIVSSLLSIHARGLSDPEALRKFAEVGSHIRALAATYDILYRAADKEVVDFCHIVPELCREVSAANGELVSLTTDVRGQTPVSADNALALSVVLNELITNSIKHGAGQKPVAVKVSCVPDGDWMVLRVVDDGPGLPQGFDPDKGQGFGFRMVGGMIRQAKGELQLYRSSGGGTTVEIRMPLAV